MTDQELFEKNMELSTEFSKHLLAHPEMESQMPEGVQIVFLVDNDPVLSQQNMALAHRYSSQGQTVMFVKVRGLRPEVSRLIEPRLEKAAGF